MAIDYVSKWIEAIASPTNDSRVGFLKSTSLQNWAHQELS